MQTHSLSRSTALSLLPALFVAGAVLGWIYETLFYRLDQGQFIRRGQGLGPWLPIYGFGFLLIFLCAWRLRRRPVLVFLASGISTGLLELVTGWVLFTFFDGLRLWDYNVEIWNWGNVGGFICARSILLFSTAGLVVVFFLIPLLVRLLDRFPRGFRLVSGLLCLLFVADIVQGYLLKGL